MTKMKCDPTLLAEVRKYGNFDPNACLQCGSCTVACELTSDSASFPRKTLRYTLFGLKKLLRSSLDPWLCYYCGDCSTTCPRETEPGEAMMTLRRYLTTQYDWTGFSKKIYQSNLWQIAALLASAAFMALLIVLFHGPIVTDRVELNTFAPAHTVHLFDITVASLVMIILFFNAFRMYWFTMHPGSSINPLKIIQGLKEDGWGFIMHKESKVKIPLRVFLTQAWTLVLHAATQKNFLKCPDKSRWIKHFLIVVGYIIMFALVVVFLEWFQTDNIYPLYHPQRWVGYFAAAALLIFTGEAIIGRIRKREEIHKFSDLTDWMFLILLFFMTLTGIAVHIFRYLGLPLATYYTYAVHLIIAFLWLVVIVPFSKWTHLLYRSLAVYYHSVKDRALQMHLAKEGASDHAAK
ncbi:MAG: 4Fe-4S dicluster domain-containing protein [Candidatus Aminicenantes bacterium]|nr:MAG: 4Fe-4S dicluster domain-containing protein [Candidatus Aminicenantes bacterium]